MENKYYNRKNGKVYIVKEDKSTIFLYRTWLGRLFLKIYTCHLLVRWLVYLWIVFYQE